MIDRLRAALRAGHAILSAEPGSGKTTLVPMMLLDEPWLQGRRILMLEPRRPAARMAARRMAALLGEAVGATVGYQVRFERRMSAATRIEVLTEGLLLRRIQADPELAGVGLVIFDEFHERHLTGDLSLALALDLTAALRADLRLLVMSASLDAAPLAALLPATPIDAAGRPHPVEIRYAERDVEMRDPIPACRRALADAVRDTDADVLVFLPGRREIERLRAEVDARWKGELDALPLYGDLPADAQDAVLQGPGSRRRVIIATDIAETSLTIPGVRAVVDSGLARRPLFDPRSGLTRLDTLWISKASALQRAGRAGRLGPGRCYRAWTAARHERLADWQAPEIAEADLAALVLEVANWGLASPDDLRWLDPPPPAHWQQACALLRDLGALDGAGHITPSGRQMARFPTHPRLAHLLANASCPADRRIAADLAALVSERDPLRRVQASARSADIGLRLDALAALRAGSALDDGVDPTAMRRVDRAARQFLRLCPRRAAGTSGLTAGRGLALAYPDRVALCAGGDARRYVLRNGRAVRVADGDPLQGRRLLAVADVDAGRRDGVVRLAAALEASEFDALFADAVETRRELRWDDGRADVVARVVQRLGALVLADDAVPLREDDATAPLLFAQIRQHGLGAFFDDPVELRARVERARQLDPEGGWPDFSEPGLLATLGDWLADWLKPGKGAGQLEALRLDSVLGGLLGWERSRVLDRWLPTQFETPAGTRRKIRYAVDGPPVLAVPLQEVLGLDAGPTLADGRVTVLLHLLSPAGRPLQVTADLAAFWAGAYASVRKEMRGRYPKHDWPEDPASARATRLTRRRR